MRERVTLSGRSFVELVGTATSGGVPYPYQRRLAEEGFPDLLLVPAGADRTLASVLPWLYRRRAHPDAAVRRATPRWLVLVLPQRALVEGILWRIEGWLDRLDLTDGGGADPADPEAPVDGARQRDVVGLHRCAEHRVTTPDRVRAARAARQRLVGAGELGLAGSEHRSITCPLEHQRTSSHSVGRVTENRR